MTFSTCDVDSQFTCNLGDCISIRKRCDTITDCSDQSDEEDCILIDIPTSYNKLESPSSNDDEPLEVFYGVTIENINQIDTKNLILETTLKFNMTWRDNRLH